MVSVPFYYFFSHVISLKSGWKLQGANNSFLSHNLNRDDEFDLQLGDPNRMVNGFKDFSRTVCSLSECVLECARTAYNQACNSTAAGELLSVREIRKQTTSQRSKTKDESTTKIKTICKLWHFDIRLWRNGQAGLGGIISFHVLFCHASCMLSCGVYKLPKSVNNKRK